ncbi:tRNA pseudouridine synthase A [Prevotella disiens FB035-09AN]|jgi:tRNA pseudouridine synthase A|uniref:tRNA pseudouridine synthase A n=1 Tax=Prevotella disiens FB035-09AN TaxID=866771 RepID=E1KTU2_9BACT|nr:tRNA pseudouridine(38-40) synthase TruA [Prevotella disiens]EFL45136.1 tRNA pseudouridine synthase A [Prevotella disiens FB035-09AN]
MQRYFIKFSYDGTNYHGWQIQPNGISVQEVLEKALSTLLRTKMSVTGAGRTDAGVHARLMVAHFDWEAPIDGQQLAYKLNRMLPRDVSVISVEAVENELHARFSATSRTYHYYMHRGRNPFSRAYSYEMPYELDFERMNEAAKYLIGERDFKCFCKAGGDNKTTICNLTEARWQHCNTEIAIHEAEKAEEWCFVITANRFLRNMVRAVVGTLVEVGRGRITIDEFRKIVDNGTRSDAGESMPGNALFLWDVTYPK